MIHYLTAAWATCVFELRRSFTFQRVAVSVLLGLFPPTMLGLVVLGAEISQSGNAISMVQNIAKILTLFLIGLVSLLSLLLWATPNVHSELEGKSWSFVASRPGGRVSVFLGKFIAAALVSFAISLLAVSCCVFLASSRLGIPDPIRQWTSMAFIFGLGSLVYSAIFSLIGTLFIRRSMVVAAGYLIGSDIVMASIPGALINKFSIRFHLQEIGIKFLGWFLPSPTTEYEYRLAYGAAWPVSIHIAIVLAITLVMLFIGIRVITSREYVTSEQV